MSHESIAVFQMNTVLVVSAVSYFLFELFIVLISSHTIYNSRRLFLCGFVTPYTQSENQAGLSSWFNSLSIHKRQFDRGTN